MNQSPPKSDTHQRLALLLKELVDAERALNEEISIDVRPGATDPQIADAEAQLGFSFPAEYRALLQCANGIDFGGTRLIGTEDLAWAEEMIEPFREIWDEIDFENYIFFLQADMDYQSNFWMFHRETSEIHDLDNGDILEEYPTIEDALREMIKTAKAAHDR